jgi:Xaa-Pro aminopeptidase
MVYFTGLIHLSDGYLIKKRGHDPILFHFSMEREEAARSGLPTKNLDDYDVQQLMKEAQGDPTKARALRLKRIFEEFDVRGRVAIYGRGEIGSHYAVLRALETLSDEVELVAEARETSVLTRARATKDEAEVERIRKMGKITLSVVADVAEFLKSHRARDGHLVDRAGNPLTIGQVKRRINLWLAMRDAENPEATIFAMGREAGIPHSTGQDDQVLQVGKPIIFDLFPCERGGGYFYDFTRTWCLGYAPPEVEEVYQDVLEVYQAMRQKVQAGDLCREIQRQTCELFEARGHSTTLSDPHTEQGYVHSLGHGLGLDVHEGPSFRNVEGNEDVLQPGAVFTLEPGLYYPERGLGVRLEDTVWLRPDGQLETLVEYPMDLVLKIEGV